MEVGEVPWPHHSRTVGAVTRTLPSPRLHVQLEAPHFSLSQKGRHWQHFNTGLFIMESGALSQGF